MNDQNLSHMTRKGVVGLTIAALATGAALGILFAPAAGRKTRDQIAKKGREAKDKMKEMLEEGRSLISKLRNEAENGADQVKDEARKAASAASKTSTAGSARS